MSPVSLTTHFLLQDTNLYHGSTTANIIPKYRINPLASARVDYCMTFNPLLTPSPKRGLLSRISQPPEPTVVSALTQDAATIANDQTVTTTALQSLMRSTPECSVNHADFEPLCYHPIFLSIETKRFDGGGQAKADLQLGAWLAAQANILQSLVKSTQGMRELPFLPGIVVQGHEWKLVIATFEVEGTEGGKIHKTRLWTSEQIFGTTSTIIGTFQIIAGFRAIFAWFQDVLLPWYRQWVLRI